MAAVQSVRVLIVEDAPADAALSVRELQRAGLRVLHRVVDEEADYREAIAEFAPEVILSDFSMPHFDGMAALVIARELAPDVPFLFVSGTLGEEHAIRALKSGATDYVLKANLIRLPAAVGRAIRDSRDAVARRLEQEALRESEERFRLLVAAVKDHAIIMLDTAGCVSSWNPRAESIKGYKAEEIIGKHFACFYPPEEIESGKPQEALRRAEAEGHSEIESWRVRKDGSRFWGNVVITALRDGTGGLRGFAEVTRDVTERKRNEEALKESERRLDLALQASALAVWDWNVATGDVRFSENWWPILGYDSHEIPFRIESWEQLTHPEDLVAVKSALARQFKGSVPLLDVEYRMRAKSGEWRWIRSVGRVVESDATGRALREVGTHGDITERRLQEEKISRLSRIREFLSGINAAIVRVQERGELLKDACRIAVSYGKFAMAWLGSFDPQTQEVTPVASAGRSEDYGLKNVKLVLRGTTPESQGIIAQAISTRRPVFSNDITKDPEVGGERRAEAIRRGYRSAIVLPLLVEGGVVGILSLFAKEPEFFNDEEFRLLDEVAANISFALELREKEAKVDFLTLYDPLTGLPNRRLFDERLQQRASAALRYRKVFSVMLIDLERFGNVNESLGRQVGDELLQHVAQRLKNAADETDVVARIGGDHFAIATQRTEESAHIPHLHEQFLTVAFGQPFEAGGRALRLAARVGIAVYPADGVDADSLFKNAEAALRNAKRTGHQYQYYAPQMNARVAERLSIENQLRAAVPEKQFVCHYQPKVDLSSRRVAGFEALIRWSHPERGLVLPSQFIPILEETGLILDVTRFVFSAVAHRHRAWLEQGFKPPRIAVNVSALDLRRADFVQDVKRAIVEGGDTPESTSIEITETMLMDDLDGNIHKLTQLRDAGIEIALDDFGTGYSSLAYLARLPISSLKIDRSFIMKIGQSPEYMSIVTTIISLARAMKFKVVAEGVETEEQANLLRLVYCDEAQGFLFGHPLPSNEAEQLLVNVRP